MIDGKCTRCGNERRVVPIYTVRPGGHMFPSLAQPDFDDVATRPRSERACGDCLTDVEILHMLGPVMQFGLGALITQIQPELTPEYPDMRVALECARTMFMVRNNDHEDQRGRHAAVRALGLAE